MKRVLRPQRASGKAASGCCRPVCFLRHCEVLSLDSSNIWLSALDQLVHWQSGALATTQQLVCFAVCSWEGLCHLFESVLMLKFLQLRPGGVLLGDEAVGGEDTNLSLVAHLPEAAETAGCVCCCHYHYHHGAVAPSAFG